MLWYNSYQILVQYLYICFYLHILHIFTLFSTQDFKGNILHSLRVDNGVIYVLFSTRPSLTVRHQIYWKWRYQISSFFQRRRRAILATQKRICGNGTINRLWKFQLLENHVVRAHGVGATWTIIPKEGTRQSVRCSVVVEARVQNVLLQYAYRLIATLHRRTTQKHLTSIQVRLPFLDFSTPCRHVLKTSVKSLIWTWVTCNCSVSCHEINLFR